MLWTRLRSRALGPKIRFHKEHPSGTANSRINFISDFPALTDRHIQTLKARNMLYYLLINANPHILLVSGHQHALGHGSANNHI
ncbi:unnamed protein product [Nezara viridula]|uniref:Uncharacterized protein n=1 Tax=Nezara viridula TaxID=85310 RepID=A0A9P0MU28_NEZVI|nr:unnamed protein product [Nezara viridula]